MKKLILGIELGSTRIKSVFTDENAKVLAQGSYEWENVLVDGLWSYSMDKVWEGLSASYTDLIASYGKPVEKIDAMGVSAMMHGYLAFDEDGKLLAPFRTWRNTNTAKASEELSELFNFNVPMRWSVSQYYQSVLDGLAHVKKVRSLHTLASYVHFKLTGNNVIGIDDASGMFPVNYTDYQPEMMAAFNALLKKKGLDVDFKTMLPKVMLAGQNAGSLTEDGAALLDKSGTLKSCPVFCPPEGDMGTGMVATNSVAVRTANVSAGTSANFTLILEKPLKNKYKEIDVVATPDGYPAALVHNNTCTTEINAWANLFEEVIALSGNKMNKGELFNALFKSYNNADDNLGITGYNLMAGEPVIGFESGKPVYIRELDGKLTLANFMKMQIYSALATTAIGVDILKNEGVAIDMVYGHGGFFKTEFVGQNALSSAVDAPVAVLDNAGEGGAWGIAILALYVLDNKLPLGKFLDGLFKDCKKTVVRAKEKDVENFTAFIKDYKKYLPVLKQAVNIK